MRVHGSLGFCQMLGAKRSLEDMLAGPYQTNQNYIRAGTFRSTVYLVTPSLLIVTAGLFIESQPINVARRVNDLTDIRNAVGAYREVHGTYPRSSNEEFTGLYNAWGPSAEDWIRGLVPRYIARLPRDPRMSSNGAEQYLYRSNGSEFKLLSFYPEDDCRVIRRRRPELLDPVRGGSGAYVCHAYGFWSQGAAVW
jgi:hypothetical protein